MKPFVPLLALALASLPMHASQASTDPSRLVESCAELVDIYVKRDQLRFAAAQTTALSEAMRAGYCRGVLDEYRRHYQCRRSDWRDQAEIIARHSPAQLEELDVDDLLAKACGY
ncbi:hypothetical protein [Stutzerimonas xanthomarina]|uniref:hypothetical protein n=1 Tax=Stutzerimonas xanthomarina TaxID=271420 RepID=UPI001C8CA07E|nr:hypothetical protein [Stutzerimonas xanthomarina]